MEPVLARSLFDLTGKTALVTGASRGIGLAIAELLADQGAHVFVSSRRMDSCGPVAEAIGRRGGKATAIACNIGRREEIAALVDRMAAMEKTPDIVVWNAAVNPYLGPMLDMPEEAFDKVLDANVANLRILLQRTVPAMAERRDGSVIIVSSIAGLRGDRTIGAYGISKAADIALARNLALEWGPSNVRFNCIAPGLVKTDFSKALWSDEQTLTNRLTRTALGRVGTPQEIAAVALLLASDGGAFITGQTIVADGGALIS